MPEGIEVKMKKIINYIKSLGWGKEDVKKIMMFIIMLLIACFILNKFLRIKVWGYFSADTETTISSPVEVFHTP